MIDCTRSARRTRLAATVVAGAALALAGPLAATAAADTPAAPAAPAAAATGTLDAAGLGASAGSLGLGSQIGSVGPLGKVDTGSLGIGADAPQLEVVENKGKQVKVKMHNPPGFVGVCAPVMADASQTVRLLTNPQDALKGGPGITGFHPLNLTGTWDSIGNPAPGIHTLTTVCAGLGASDMSFTLLPVPGTTMGSLEGMVDFGSAIVGS